MEQSQYSSLTPYLIHLTPDGSGSFSSKEDITRFHKRFYDLCLNR
jgi:hypothetical protein